MMLKCIKCATYTLEDKCKCGGKAVSPHPARFSVEDKYGKYRRMAKRKSFIDEKSSNSK
jgi:H/ACA ribonucleoprotein complex subunit 3